MSRCPALNFSISANAALPKGASVVKRISPM